VHDHGCITVMQNARTMVSEPTVVHKRCTKCRITKAASEFFRFKFSSDGLQSYCKVGCRIGKGVAIVLSPQRACGHGLDQHA
jgi:hypothetical protein